MTCPFSDALKLFSSSRICTMARSATVCFYNEKCLFSPRFFAARLNSLRLLRIVAPTIRTNHAQVVRCRLVRKSTQSVDGLSRTNVNLQQLSLIPQADGRRSNSWRSGDSELGNIRGANQDPAWSSTVMFLFDSGEYEHKLCVLKSS